MYFDRYDIALAWYHYLTCYHEGQFSDKYSRLSRLQQWFTPSHSQEFLCTLETEGYENALAIYTELERTQP